MSPGMCVNLCKDGDFRFFFKEMPACAGMTTLGRFSRFSWNQGDARLRGHDNLIKLYRSNNPDYSSEESSST